MPLRGSRLRGVVLWLCCLECLAYGLPESPVSFETNKHNIIIVGDNFTIDGQPFQIISGSLHYFRVPAAYWKDRLHKLKAAGLNAVSTYVEWSFHEPEERQYSFEGDRDLATFVRLAAKEGLYVLLRPGPYICAERDMGGFPYWLLGKYPKIALRTTDADYMAETKIWLAKLFEQLTPLLFGNGGPIILVQVENEYGSYGKDMEYKTQMRDILLKHVGDKALLYTTDGDGPSYFKKGYIPEVLTTIDFGVGTNVTKSYETLRSFMQHGPLMNSEFYPGWLTHWGESFHTVSSHAVVKTLKEMLKDSINLNFYVFFGGTNFEFTSGANIDGKYVPDITSYDYDAPLSEAGDPTPKYFAIRDLLTKHNPQIRFNDTPKASNKSAYGKITLTEHVRLLSPAGRIGLGRKYADVVGFELPTFEKLRQRAGLMLYETKIGEAHNGSELKISRPRDRIHVYVDNKFYGTLCRSKGVLTLPIDAKANSVLSLLVENQGHVNYGHGIHDFKGILSNVTIKGKVINGHWSVTGFPLEDFTRASAVTSEEGEEVEGPILYDGYFTIPKHQQPQDTFLDTTKWGKGYIWINGHNLGRYWPGVGPQVTLYVPGCWLEAAPAHNHVRVLELDKPPTVLSIDSIDYPILNRTANAKYTIFNY